MHQVFSIATKDGDEIKREIAILRWTNNENPYHALHKLGVEYATSPEGAKVRDTGLTFGTLLNHLTPEMLAPYGIEIMWPEREAIQLENGRQIVSCYEIQSHLEARDQERQRAFNWERKLRETSEKFARRLERLKAERHPVIATWDSSRICGRAISWAHQYIKAGGLNADGFFDKKLADAKPCKASFSQSTEQEDIPQSA